MALSGTPMLAIPLTRTKKSGEPYRRPPDVEAQLETLLRASVAEQLTSAVATDSRAPEYLKDECLVYLIREAALAEDAERYSTLMTSLLKRCTRGIERKLRALGVADDDVADVYGEIILAMMSAILAADGSGEFYQVRFRRALRFQLLKTYDWYALRQRRAKREQPLDSLEGATDEGDEAAGTLAEVLESTDTVAEDAERRMFTSQALDAIRDPRHREAFVLHHFYDWPIEAIDPREPSISQRFDRTPRMVRNWLRTADRELAAWRAAKRV